MSQQLFEDDTKFLQRFLKSADFNLGIINGILGSKTDTAEGKFFKKSQEIATTYATFHQRTESNILTLHPKAQEAARQFLTRLHNAGINARIISGTRTYAEQDELYAKGRTKPGPKVTNAKGGQSNNNFGIAWDIGIFDNQGAYLPESPLYDRAAEVGLIDGLEWGRDWQSFIDKPHYQLVTGLSIATVRSRFEQGESYA
jgi:peptidoglycan L-alanyl-D-glutamate endopeptidase CwlK